MYIYENNAFKTTLLLRLMGLLKDSEPLITGMKVVDWKTLELIKLTIFDIQVNAETFKADLTH